MFVKMNQKYNRSVILFGLLAVIAVGISFLLMHDNDFMWHKVLGENIVKNGKIMNEDTFSWISPELGLVEVAHSWLSSVVIYFTQMIANNIYAGALIFVCVTAFLLYFTIQKLFIKRISIVSFITVYIVGIICRNPRPQNIGFILFSIALWALIKTYKDSKTKAWLLLPIISVFWANFHGGSIVLLFAFELYFIVISIIPNITINQLSLDRGDNYDMQTFKNSTAQFFSNSLNLFYATVLSALCGMINPYGISLYKYALGTNSEAVKMFVSEWTPIEIVNYKALILLAALILPLLLQHKKVKGENWIIVLICLISAGIYRRFVVYGLLCSIILFKDLFDEIEERIKKIHISKWIKILAMSVAVVIVCGLAYFNRDGIYYSKHLSENVINYIRTSNYERLYNGYNEGSELIYNNIKCFVDARADLYPDDLILDAKLAEYNNFLFMGSLETFLNRYRFDGVMVKTTHVPMADYLNLSNDWQVDAIIDDYIFFKRLTPYD